MVEVPSQGFRHILSRLPLRHGSLPAVKELQAVTFYKESANDAQKLIGTPKCNFLGNVIRPKLFGCRVVVFKKLAFWRTYVGLSVTGSFLAKSYCL